MYKKSAPISPVPPPRPPKSQKLIATQMSTVIESIDANPNGLISTMSANNHQNSEIITSLAGSTSAIQTTIATSIHQPMYAPNHYIPGHLQRIVTVGDDESTAITIATTSPTPTPTPTTTTTTTLSTTVSNSITSNLLGDWPTNNQTTLRNQTRSQRRRPPPPGSAIQITSLSSSISESQTQPIASLQSLQQQSSNIQQQATLSNQISPVTLTAPRPETERLSNEYVDTPFRSTPITTRIQYGSPINEFCTIAPVHQSFNIQSGRLADNGTATVKSLTIPTAITHIQHHSDIHSRIQTTQIISSAQQLADGKCHQKIAEKQLPQNSGTDIFRCTDIPSVMRSNSRCERTNALPITAITKQPLPFSKDSSTAALHDDIDLHPTNGETLNSITCPQCKRCRCEECQRPRQLPSRWVCDNNCLCSAETIIDYISCLCCVKALFYHCSKDHEIECEGDSISCADDPCSCLPHKRTQRWAWLSALSLALPCLWFYWPMRGCIAICAKCYARHSRHGCRCPIQNSKQTSGINNNSGLNNGTNNSRIINRTGDLTPEKRLLDSSPEF